MKKKLMQLWMEGSRLANPVTVADKLAQERYIIECQTDGPLPERWRQLGRLERTLPEEFLRARFEGEVCLQYMEITKL